MYSEAQLIKRIIAAVPSVKGRTIPSFLHQSISLGIGDDSAIIAPPANSDLVLSCDASLEGIHFLPKTYPPDSIGYKSLARATSDLAAMGATPRFFLLSLALPESRTARWLDTFLVGMARAARELGIRLIGGDTTSFPTIIINITVVGMAPRARATSRSGARPGDLIYVSGKLGQAQLGLALMQHRLNRMTRNRPLLQPHLYPKIRLTLAAWLAQKRLPTSMMDLSDGLSTDLARLCDASQVGARLFEAQIPRVEIPPDAKLSNLNLNPLATALHGGEDYELLFTIPPTKVSLLKKAPEFRHLSPIGEITRQKRITVTTPSGRTYALKPQGWDPFR